MRCVRNFVPLLLHATVVTKNTGFLRRNTKTIAVRNFNHTCDFSFR